MISEYVYLVEMYMWIVASSIYVYRDMRSFEHFYKGFLDEPLRKINILDIYIKNNDRLWIVTNSNDMKEKPLLQKSLVHFRNGDISGYDGDDVKLLLYDKLKFNEKKMKLEFFPRFLRKPLLTWRVDRYLNVTNTKTKNKLVDYSHKYYDYEYDRINLILKD